MDTYSRVRRPATLLDASGPSAGRADIAMSDWLVLLGAVSARLRATARRGPVDAVGAPAFDAGGRLRADVLECADALDRLHAALSRIERS